MAPAHSLRARHAALAGVFLLALATPALADLQICNRTSFVAETALGVDTKGVTATRGWFRVDPGQCRTVLRGTPDAERLFLHARALPIYGAVRPLTPVEVQFCVGEGDFLVAGARRCTKAGERLVPFAEVKPRESEGNLMLSIAEPADYGVEQARRAAVQRLLMLAGYGSEPIDGVAGPRTEAALNQFLRDRGLAADAQNSPAFIDLLIDAVRAGARAGLLWCNETPHTVMAALGVEESGAIVTRGWWRIEPGACLRPELPRRAGPRAYSFAEAVDPAGAAIERNGKPVSWGGGEPLCTRNSRFEIHDHATCRARGLAVQGFAPVEIGGTGATVRFRMP
jgi:uncharacterized membrane protein